MHGEKPSAEYAKLRRESLESKFGNVLGAHRSKSASVVYRFGPFLALYRAVIISFHLLKLTIWQFFVHDTKRRSIKVMSLFVDPNDKNKFQNTAPCLNYMLMLHM